MSVRKLQGATYRVYWESQHGDDPQHWLEKHGISYELEDNPEREALWPYQQSYDITLSAPLEDIEKFEDEFV